jgi:hypothetical protein
MDDFKDVNKRQSFHAQYGKLAVSVAVAQGRRGCCSGHILWAKATVGQCMMDDFKDVDKRQSCTVRQAGDG